jgi:hypothetical protein
MPRHPNLTSPSISEGRELLGVEWKLPPPEDAYILRYGKGNEEGDSTLLVTVDRKAREIAQPCP